MKKEKKNKKLKFIIVSSRQTCGGGIVLHALCKNLCELGHSAKIFYPYAPERLFEGEFKHRFRQFKHTIVDLVGELKYKIFGEKIIAKNEEYKAYENNSVKKFKRKFFITTKKDTIVVYPESMSGDFFKTNFKVRHILFTPDKRIDIMKELVDKNILVTFYREIFAEGLNLSPENKLHTSYFDLELYKRTNYGERNGKCYVIRKGKDRTDLPKEFDGVIVDDLTEEEKVRVFNECEYCISYDTQTAYSGIAGMCGCVSVVVPEEGKSRKDYLKGNDKAYGVAYGFSEEEIEWAKSTCDKVKEHYEKLNADSLEQTKNFVELCKKKFNL